MRDLPRRGASEVGTWSAFRPPLADLGSWLGDLDKLFGRPTLGAESGRSQVPQLHVSRTDEGYRVTADLPGFAEGDVKLDAHAGVLTLSGQRTTGNWEEHAAVRRERSSMRFATSVRLPEDANIDTVAGKLTDGVLTISISHKPEVKPRQIKIQAT